METQSYGNTKQSFRQFVDQEHYKAKYDLLKLKITIHNYPCKLQTVKTVQTNTNEFMNSMLKLSILSKNVTNRHYSRL